MADALDIIFEFVESLRPDIVKNQSDKGLRASGKSALSLRTESKSGNIVQLIDGSGSFKFQDSPGRGPSGNVKSDIPLWKRIYDWLEYRKYRLNWRGEKQRKSMAYAIANKIHTQGNFIAITGKVTGVVKDVITDQRMTLLRDQIGKFYVRSVVNSYLQSFSKN